MSSKYSKAIIVDPRSSSSSVGSYGSSSYGGSSYGSGSSGGSSGSSNDSWYSGSNNGGSTYRDGYADNYLYTPKERKNRSGTYVSVYNTRR